MANRLTVEKIAQNNYFTSSWCSVVCSALLIFKPLVLMAQTVDPPQVDKASTAKMNYRENQTKLTFAELKDKFSEIELSPPELNFADFYKKQLSIEQSKTADTVFQFVQFDPLAKNFLPDKLCDSIALSEMLVIVEIAKQRAELLKKGMSRDKEYQGSFHKLKNGKQWYKHWLNSWLMSNVSIDELENMANSELSLIKQLREAIVIKSLPDNEREFSSQDAQHIIKSFRRREKTVNSRLNSFFGYSTPTTALKIIPSTLPKSFPAPGIYNSLTREFIYHLQSETMPEKYMDWLFLHEGLPGHHYQSQIAINSPLCNELNSEHQSSVFSEGWAAYVETMGDELGLYKDSSSAMYALDWRALRAVRVLLDIGIHYYGWSDDKARQVWMAHIPKQTDIMEREIARIHNWPAQVITYVFGKEKIAKAIENIKKKHNKYSSRAIHRAILSVSNHSLNALNFIDEVLVKQEQNEHIEKLTEVGIE